MTEWTYGVEGETFPVEIGQFWKCGNHTFHCGDVMTTAIPGREEATLVYSDPPWGATLLNGFRTKAGVPKATHTWQQLYAEIAAHGHLLGLPIYVEGSVDTNRDGAQIPGTLIHPNYPHSAYWRVKYYDRYPSGLYYRGITPHPAALDTILPGADDDDTPGMVMAQYPVGTVIDPCAGRGQTSREAERMGWASINNELNPHRMSAALTRMQKLTGSTPERIG